MARARLWPRRAIDQTRTAGGGSGSGGMCEVKVAGGAGGGCAAGVLVKPTEKSATMKVKVMRFSGTTSYLRATLGEPTSQHTPSWLIFLACKSSAYSLPMHGSTT